MNTTKMAQQIRRGVRESERMSAEEFRKIKDELGWSQGEIGTHLGISQQAVSEYLRGVRQMPANTSKLLRLCISDHRRHQRAKGAKPQDNGQQVTSLE